jgi:membrane-associated phospholipid phosphatase
MKKPKTSPVTVSSIFNEMLAILREAGLIAWGWKWWYLAALAVAVPALLLLMRSDIALLNVLRTQNVTANAVAGSLSRIGETTGTTLCVYAVLLTAGIVLRRGKLTRAALCIMLAVIVSGVGVNLMRPAFGRARPYSQQAGEFHGLSVKHEFNGFPSGHSSEAWTLATIASFAYPPAAVPACAYAGSMMWARMQRNQHFPADVTAGAIWGIMCALPFAVAYRRRTGQMAAKPPERSGIYKKNV